MHAKFNLAIGMHYLQKLLALTQIRTMTLDCSDTHCVTLRKLP